MWQKHAYCRKLWTTMIIKLPSSGWPDESYLPHCCFCGSASCILHPTFFNTWRHVYREREWIRVYVWRVLLVIWWISSRLDERASLFIERYIWRLSHFISSISPTGISFPYWRKAGTSESDPLSWVPVCIESKRYLVATARWKIE